MKTSTYNLHKHMIYQYYITKFKNKSKQKQLQMNSPGSKFSEQEIDTRYETFLV